MSSQLTDPFGPPLPRDLMRTQSISSMGSSETRGSTDTQKHRAGGHLPDYYGEEAPERGGESRFGNRGVSDGRELRAGQLGVGRLRWVGLRGTGKLALGLSRWSRGLAVQVELAGRT